MEYRKFECVSQAGGTRYHCSFIFLQTAISLRHSDTVDVRYLVNGKRITVALPHVAFAEYNRRAGRDLTDEEAGAIAARYLKEVLEKGGEVEDLAVPMERVLELTAGAAAPGSPPAGV